MKKSLAVLALAVVAALSQAAINLNIDNPDQSVNLPTSGTVTLTFTGTITCSSDWKPDGNSFAAYPALQNSSTNLATTAFDGAYLTYIGTANYGDDYSGNLFTVTVASTDAPGYYGFLVNSNDAAYMSVEGVHTSGNKFNDSESFSVTVNAVPEPASMGVLGLGVAALLRRRRK